MTKLEIEQVLRNHIGTAAEYMAPSELAAMAVIASHVMSNMERDRGPDSTLVDGNHPGDSFPMGYEFIRLLENEMVRQLENNGGVVRYVGQAAKQINPLLS